MREIKDLCFYRSTADTFTTKAGSEQYRQCKARRDHFPGAAAINVSSL